MIREEAHGRLLSEVMTRSRTREDVVRRCYRRLAGFTSPGGLIHSALKDELLSWRYIAGQALSPWGAPVADKEAPDHDDRPEAVS